MSNSIKVATAFERFKPTAVIIGNLAVNLELLTAYIRIIGQFASIDAVDLQLLKPLRSLRPDITIFSVDLDVLNGVELVRRISQEFQNTKFLIVTDSYHATKYQNQLMRAGAHGFCLRSSGVAALIEAIRYALRGQPYCDPRITQLVKQSSMTSMPNSSLTDREVEVLKLLDFKNVVIAERLEMKLRTVEKHIECILAKLNVPTRTAAGLKALALGLIVLPNDEENLRAEDAEHETAETDDEDAHDDETDDEDDAEDKEDKEDKDDADDNDDR